MREHSIRCRFCGEEVILDSNVLALNRSVVCPQCGYRYDNNTASESAETSYDYSEQSVEEYPYRRGFRRYNTKQDAAIKAGRGEYRGLIVDYSDGVSLLFEEDPQVEPGTLVNVKSDDSGITLVGEVVWVANTAEGVRVGIKRIDNLRGSLKYFRLADVLSGLYRTASTGTLEVRNGSVLKSVYFKDGNIIYASSSLTDERLEEFLLKKRKITPEQYKELNRLLIESDKGLEAVLLEKGFISPETLLDEIRNQVETIVLSLFTLEVGEFEFQEGPLPLSEIITVDINTPSLLFRGIKSIDNVRFIRESVPSMDVIPFLLKDPLISLASVSLSVTDKKVFTLIDNRTTLRELLTQSPLNDFETLRIIYALHNTGIIGYNTEKCEDHLQKKDTSFENEFIRKIEDLYSVLGSKSYYELLGVEKDASEKEIRDAYYKLVKKYHPDRYPHLPGYAAEMLNSIFSAITEAYNTLSEPEKRVQYSMAEQQVETVETTREDLARKRFEEGQAELNRKNLTEAESLFAQAIYLAPEEAKYHYYRGMTLYKIGEIKKAARCLGEAVRLDPNNARYFAELGHLYLKLGFEKRARSMFERSLKVSPGYGRALDGLAMLNDNESKKDSIFKAPEIILRRIARKYGFQ